MAEPPPGSRNPERWAPSRLRTQQWWPAERALGYLKETLCATCTPETPWWVEELCLPWLCPAMNHWISFPVRLALVAELIPTLSEAQIRCCRGTFCRQALVKLKASVLTFFFASHCADSKMRLLCDSRSWFGLKHLFSFSGALATIKPFGFWRIGQAGPANVHSAGGRGGCGQWIQHRLP